MKIFFFEKFSENPEVMTVVLLIFGILIFASALFFIWGKLKPQANLTELKQRTKSWWVMAVIFVSSALINPIISYVAFAFLSFFALRELVTISKNIRDADRRIIIWCYLAIPAQYYFAYKGWYSLFLTFIPVFMFIWLPFMLVVRGVTEGISRSMSVLPTQLLFTTFSISHLAFMLSLPELPGFTAGGRGLLLFIVFITQMNDVFQFTWGKLFGKFKILPKVSPNKTWEGFLGGLFTSIIVGYFLRFLTPLDGVQALWVSGLVACAGFVGDVLVSAIKRDIGKKDTGDMIPGHGGILDRVDSLAITAPFFFHIVYNLCYLNA
jgi:phosphatidate cytidylyltransferase